MYRKMIAGLFLFTLIALPAMAGDDEEKPQITYFALKPSIVSNLTGGPKYIRCDIQLMTEQPDEVYQLETHAPALRHTILMLIAGQDGRALTSRDGKEKLRTDALESVQTTLKEMTGKEIVNDLYFTAYYVK